ncbi:protein AIG1-like [Solanum tuberosum]|uniref:protein AIG1-like n=1 Tax=Solanum tuberosum TaxID=4113 RepID=UPI00073A0144|nr:PREDICTED: protein AIG1-like [Solanum tuberosum]
MGGCGTSIDGWEFDKTEARTLVLIGCAGDGKSSTGNSIVGRNVFRSMPHSAGVTSTCEHQRTNLPNDQILHVIDTPGLFDFSAAPEVVRTEFLRCVDLAEDGIHAVLLVLSVRNRFSKEQQAAVQSFQEFFGGKISDYMIVVFTGGDDLEDHDVTLDDYLGSDCPELLKETLAMCENRVVLFDNKTQNQIKRAEQLRELLFEVNLVVEENDGKPYTNNLFKKFKANVEQDIKELKDQMQRSHEEQFSRITEMVESKLEEKMQRLEKQLKMDRAARVAAEQKVKKDQKKSKHENRKLESSMVLDKAFSFLLCLCVFVLIYWYLK